VKPIPNPSQDIWLNGTDTEVRISINNNSQVVPTSCWMKTNLLSTLVRKILKITTPLIALMKIMDLETIDLQGFNMEGLTYNIITI
jgi:hypothetical protein